MEITQPASPARLSFNFGLSLTSEARLSATNVLRLTDVFPFCRDGFILFSTSSYLKHQFHGYFNGHQAFLIWSNKDEADIFVKDGG